MLATKPIVPSAQPPESPPSPPPAAPLTPRPGILDAARAFGVTFGPTALLDAAAAGSAALWAAGLLGRRPATAAGRLAQRLAPLGVAGAALYLLAVQPWHRGWGATAAEMAAPLPGDDLVPEPGLETTRAVTVMAPAAAVWPWVAQIGQDRGGFYSYGWLENLAGCRLRNADRVHPEWQHRAVGDIVKLHPATGMPVTRFEPGRALVLGETWAFVVEPVDGRSCRLIARGRVPRGLTAFLYALFVEIPHFVMERRMLLGIKERAERAWTA